MCCAPLHDLQAQAAAASRAASGNFAAAAAPELAGLAGLLSVRALLVQGKDADAAAMPTEAVAPRNQVGCWLLCKLCCRCVIA